MVTFFTKKREFKALALSLLLLLPLISSCVPDEIQRPLCTLDVFRPPEINEKNIFFFLVEGSKEYSSSRELQKAQIVIQNLVEGFLNPEDRVIIGWLDNSSTISLNEMVFLDLDMDFLYEEIPPPPPLPKYTDIPEPKVNTTLVSDVAKEGATMTASYVKEVNSRAEEAYNCEQNSRNSAYLAERRTEAASLASRMVAWRGELVSAISTSPLYTRLEFESFSNSRLPVMEALVEIDGLFSTECVGGRRCILFVFSNLADPRISWADLGGFSHRIRLNNSGLILICPSLNDSCQKSQKYWKEVLEKDFGAKDVELVFFSNSSEFDWDSILTNEIIDRLNKYFQKGGRKND